MYSHVDGPLPIGCGQTISQPTLVLEMTRMLDPRPNDTVLEIGTGSGYQTAMLSMLSGHVYTVERLLTLAVNAQERLASMGFANIDYKIGDGSEGWTEHAPYDRIMVTAGAGALPSPLVDQLACGGRMVIPVGPRHTQDLLLVTKAVDGSVTASSMMKVVFVELVGSYGFGSERP